MARTEIFHQIESERKRQDEQWGGPAHDDQHSADDWTGFITKQMDWAEITPDPCERRERFLKIAALAIAAIESFDRQKNRGVQ